MLRVALALAALLASAEGWYNEEINAKHAGTGATVKHQGKRLNRKASASVPEPPPDPSAFLVQFALAKNTGDPLGNFTVRVSPNWAPIAAARIKSLVEDGFFDDSRLFEVVDGSKTRDIKIAQAGISGDPAVNKKWASQFLEDEPRLVSNRKGTVAFTQMGPGMRSTQMMINLGDNGRIFDHGGMAGAEGYTPWGEVVQNGGLGMLLKLQATPELPDGAVDLALENGNAYLDDWHPYLTRIVTAQLIHDPSAESTNDALADTIAKVKHERLKQQAGIPEATKAVPNPSDVRAALQEAKDSGDYGKVAELLREHPYLANHLAADAAAVDGEAVETLGEKDLAKKKKKKGKTMKRKKKKKPKAEV